MRAALSAVALAAAGTAALAQPSPPGGKWVQTFVDDFDGPSLNTSNWNVAVNRTQDAGHAVFIPEAVSVADSNLVITATRQPWPVGNETRNFTGGWVDSRDNFFQQGGRWEARIKLPPTSASCSWPAFWILPNPYALCWPIGVEVDIMEYVAGFQYQHGNRSLPSAIDGGIHYGYSCYDDVGGGIGATFPNTSDTTAPVIDFSADYHVFGAVINETGSGGSITWYVDGQQWYTFTQPQQPNITWGKSPYIPFSSMYAIINYSIAPYGCPQPPPNGAWEAPHQLLVDWVKVYQWQPDAQDAAVAADGAATA